MIYLNEQIKRELNHFKKEWDKQCAAEDKTLKCRTKNCGNKLDEVIKAAMTAELINIGANNNIIAAALWTAYLNG